MLAVITLAGAVIISVTIAAPAHAAAYTPGDLFLSVGTGQVQERKPDGTLVQTLNSGNSGAFNTGSAFDANGNLFVTEFSGQTVSKFDANGGFVGNFGSGYDSDPESVRFDNAGNVYVGQADGAHNILKFNSSGTLLASYNAAGEDRGTDWIDLAADQCTMHYTSEGTSVKAFNVCTNTQLPDFATGLPGLAAYAHRILPDGGELVADSNAVVRLNSSGAVVKTYTPSNAESNLFALNLDPDGLSFWTADLSDGNVYHFDIASGAQLGTFATGVGVDGLSLFGESCATGCKPPPPPSGNGTIFEVTFEHCMFLHVGYNRFKDGTVVNWNVTVNGKTGHVAQGQFTAIGGGKLGSKTFHFLTIPLGTTLPNEASGIQSHVHFHWGTNSSLAVTRDSGC